MDKLSKITDVLLAYAKGGAPIDSIPRVQANFQHNPTDMPGYDTWELTVTLYALEKPVEHAPIFAKTWEAKGIDRETCLDDILRQLNDFLTEAMAEKMMQQEALETSMNLLLAESTLGEIWQADPKEMERAAEAEEEKQPSLIILAGR